MILTDNKVLLILNFEFLKAEFRNEKTRSPGNRQSMTYKATRRESLIAQGSHHRGVGSGGMGDGRGGG